MAGHQDGPRAATEPGTPGEATWRLLYRTGAVAAAAFVILVAAPIVLVVIAPLPPTDGRAVLEYIAQHRVLYLVELICFVGLAVPALLVFLAAAVALWDGNRNLALIGGVLGIGSELIALAIGNSPQSLHGGLVLLSDSYANASSDAERAGLASAADALVASTNGVTWAGILTAAAILVLSLAMRRGGFGTVVAVLGIVTGSVGVVSEALRPMMGAGYALYGLLLPVWFALVGVRLWSPRHAGPA